MHMNNAHYIHTIANVLAYMKDYIKRITKMKSMNTVKIKNCCIERKAVVVKYK